MNTEFACHLCGLPAGGSNISMPVAGQTVSFCCPGCMYVFQILFNSPEGFPEDHKNTELYKACVSAGLIPSETGEGGIYRENSNPGEVKFPLPMSVVSSHADTESDSMADIREGLSRELSLRIEGMWCVACSWLIEQLLRKMDGVLSAGIFFFSDIARIKYLPHVVRPQQIIDSITRLGYRALPVEKGPESSESRDLMVRLGVSAILCMNIMMISFALWTGFFEDIGREGAVYFSYVLWIIATPAVFYCGWPIIQRAIAGVLHGVPNMDALIATGVLSAYFYSFFQMLKGSLHVYFDTASTLITLLLLGRYIELRARERISSGITALFHAANTKARVLKDGKEVWTSGERVLPGDLFLVLRGERVPVDGRVVSSGVVVDESVITGESRPVEKSDGATVPAGALLLGESARFEAERPGGESSLNQIVTLIQEALSTKNRVELFADRAMRFLVPGILILAASVAVSLLLFDFPSDEALLRAMTILVITCPCALGIATPLARVAAIARARSSGILIRNPGLFEQTEGLQEIVLDKTGTVTEGRYTLREIIALEGSEEEALRRVASGEVKSDHFLARETVRAARERSLDLHELLSVEPLEGLGIVALTGAGEVIAGNRRLMAHHGFELPEDLDVKARALEAGGATVVFFAWNDSLQGVLVFGDRIRKNAAESISALKALGVTVRMVSGDSESTTGAVARELGIEEYRGQALPKDKVDVIAEIQAGGGRVAMAGDGINDAAALARADIGITVGPGANLLRECADAAVFGDDPMKIPELIALSRLTYRIIRQNLIFAFIYNLLGIPIAAAGFLNPIIAALAMFASSATVIFNTLRISRFSAGQKH